MPNRNHIQSFKIINKVKTAIANTEGLLLPRRSRHSQPLFYSQEPHPKTVITDDLRRDVFECVMLKVADENHLPIFGICRGMQLCNIWYGGSLHQDVPNHRNVLQTYRVCKNFTFNGSIVRRVLENSQDSLTGESRHHQTIDRIGKNLSVICTHEDGTIKALEHLGKRFIVLVQWHPESIVDPSKKFYSISGKSGIFYIFYPSCNSF